MDRLLPGLAAAVLALLALGGAMFGMKSGFFSEKNARFATDVAQFVTATRGGFSTSPEGYSNFTTANASYLITHQMVPGSMVRNGVLTDVWGNAIQLSSANNGSQAVMSYGGGGSQTEGDCAKHVSNLTDYSSLKVGSTTFTDTKPDAIKAAQACATGTAIVMTYQ